MSVCEGRTDRTAVENPSKLQAQSPKTSQASLLSTIHEDSAAYEVSTSSLTKNAITNRFTVAKSHKCVGKGVNCSVWSYQRPIILHMIRRFPLCLSMLCLSGHFAFEVTVETWLHF